MKTWFFKIPLWFFLMMQGITSGDGLNTFNGVFSISVKGDTTYYCSPFSVMDFQQQFISLQQDSGFVLRMYYLPIDTFYVDTTNSKK